MRSQHVVWQIFFQCQFKQPSPTHTLSAVSPRVQGCAPHHVPPCRLFRFIWVASPPAFPGDGKHATTALGSCCQNNMGNRGISPSGSSPNIPRAPVPLAKSRWKSCARDTWLLSKGSPAWWVPARGLAWSDCHFTAYCTSPLLPRDAGMPTYSSLTYFKTEFTLLWNRSWRHSENSKEEKSFAAETTHRWKLPSKMGNMYSQPLMDVH